MPDYETKDVHTASGGTFETKNAPGYHPAAPVNADRSNEAGATPAPATGASVETEPEGTEGSTARKAPAKKTS